MFFFLLQYVVPKIKLCIIKNNLHALLSKIRTSQNSYSKVLHDFQQVVFHTQDTIFVFHDIQKFITFML